MRELSHFFPEGLPPALAIVGQVVWLLQIALVIHVYRTGRPYWWIWVLLVAPLLGGLAYVFVELLPDFESPRGLLYSLKPRAMKIRDLRDQLEECETVENRLALARVLSAAGKLDEAHDVASDCLKGVFKDDPHTMAAVVRFKLALKRYEEANALLEKLSTKADRMLELQVEVMRGDCLAGLGRHAEAEQAYERVIGRYIGEAPRAGLAVVYEKTGRASEAAALWHDIRARFRKAGRAWRRSERDWYKLAKVKLSEKKN